MGQPGEDDSTPPARPLRFRAFQIDSTHFGIEWMAPGDDGREGGPVFGYWLRYGPLPMPTQSPEQAPAAWEAWNGAVVRLGRERGVPTPTHGFLYAALLPQHRAAAG